MARQLKKHWGLSSHEVWGLLFASCNSQMANCLGKNLWSRENIKPGLRRTEGPDTGEWQRGYGAGDNVKLSKLNINILCFPRLLLYVVKPEY